MRVSVLILLLLLSVKAAEAKVAIFVCEPEWASLAREIVGNKAQILTGSSPMENVRNIRVNSGLVRVIRTADMVFCSGGGLESKWLNKAIEESGNVSARTNPEALFLISGDADRGAKILPRVHLNPYNIALVATEFTRRVKLLDAVNASFYQGSYEKFSVKWQNSIKLWEKAAVPLKGMRVVINDDSWLDLARWLGLEVAAKIETQKSFVKNNQNLNGIALELKEKPAKAIIFANYEDKRALFWLGEKTKTRVILLPFTVGGAANSSDLFSLFATTINLLLVDCSKSLCPKLTIVPTKEN